MTLPLTVAHRGYSARYPENTVASARAAIDAGADLVEADVRFSAEGALFCFHDAELGRLTGEAVAVAACTDAQLRALRYGGEAPAAFADILAEVPGRAGLLVDVKLTTPAMTCALHDALAAAGWPEGVWLGLRAPAQAAEARALLGTRVRILALMPQLGDAEAFLAAGVDALRLWEKHLACDEAAALRDRGPVWVTAGATGGRAVGDVDAAAVGRILAFGPDAVLLNDPTALGRA